jgi:hypothetical protein
MITKNPKTTMGDEEIIQRRDRVDNSPHEPLDGEERRALADARLRALAFALKPDKSPVEGSSPIEEAELLDYLLDNLPPGQLDELEGRLRGNTALFRRLINLYSALTSRANSQDRRHVDDLVRKVPRHKAGEIEIRSIGEVLQFRGEGLARGPQPAAPSPHGYAQVQDTPFLHSMAGSEPAPSPRMAVRKSAPSGRRLGHLGMMLAKYLALVGHEFAVGKSMVDDAHSLLQQMQRQEHVSASDAEEAEGRLIALLREIQQRADHVREELRSALQSTSNELRIRAVPDPSIAADMELGSSARLSRETFFEDWAFPGGDWAESLGIDAGPYSLRLAGVALPSPRVRITIENATKIHGILPQLSLVRPHRGFESAIVVPSGEAQINVPRGESVLLVQADEVWEIELRLLAG